MIRGRPRLTRTYKLLPYTRHVVSRFHKGYQKDVQRISERPGARNANARQGGGHCGSSANGANRGPGTGAASRRAVACARRLRCGSVPPAGRARSEEHTSELQSLMRISYAVFCLKKKTEHTK